MPLVLAQAAVAVAPAVADEKMRIPDQAALEQMGVAREVLEALAKSPDGELVRVEERDEQVVITKQGRTLQIRVHSAKEDVSVNVPLVPRAPGAAGRAREHPHRRAGGRARRPCASRTSWTSRTATTTCGSTCGEGDDVR